MEKKSDSRMVEEKMFSQGRLMGYFSALVGKVDSEYILEQSRAASNC